jgi:hypothetical protein
MISHLVINVYKIKIELSRTSDVVNVLWSVGGVHMKYDDDYYFFFFSVAGSLVKCGVVVDEIYMYFHILCVVIC